MGTKINPQSRRLNSMTSSWTHVPLQLCVILLPGNSNSGPQVENTPSSFSLSDSVQLCECVTVVHSSGVEQICGVLYISGSDKPCRHKYTHILGVRLFHD